MHERLMARFGDGSLSIVIIAAGVAGIEFPRRASQEPVDLAKAASDWPENFDSKRHERSFPLHLLANQC